MNQIPQFTSGLSNIGKIDAKLLSQCQYKNPFQTETNGLSRLIPSFHVTAKQGTGLVHIGSTTHVFC
jgi:isoleucyl-tRNA synthetase